MKLRIAVVAAMAMVGCSVDMPAGSDANADVESDSDPFTDVDVTTGDGGDASAGDAGPGDDGDVDDSLPQSSFAPYEIGVRYHSTTSDFADNFLNKYHLGHVRDDVRAQLQAMADDGATAVYTLMYIVNDDTGLNTTQGDSSFVVTAQSQEVLNFVQYAKDVRDIRGPGGRTLRLNIQLSPAHTWAADPITNVNDSFGPAPYTRDGAAFLAAWRAFIDVYTEAAASVVWRDGTPVVSEFALLNELMLNSDGTSPYDETAADMTTISSLGWFMTEFWPYFWDTLSAAHIRPMTYFLAWSELGANRSAAGYTFPNWLWKVSSSLDWFEAQMPGRVPSRLEVSAYFGQDDDPTDVAALGVSIRALCDAHGIATADLAETDYVVDDTARAARYSELRTLLQNGELSGVFPWTTPNGGGDGTNVGPPFDLAGLAP